MEKRRIELFNIPQHIIETSQFDSMLHGSIVKQFESNFAEYVGSKHAVSLNSATNAIFLINTVWKQNTYRIPTMIPPVVPNAIITSGSEVRFIDDTSWVGNSYILARHEDFRVIDSAHKVDRDQFKKEAYENDLMIFSFYSTKPVGGADGCIVVSNDKEKIDILRTMAYNGMSQEPNNWERKQSMIGYKMYLNSIQAYIANENLKRLDEKKSRLKEIRDIYNSELGLNNTSDHLYRVNREDREGYMETAKMLNITCGIHYSCVHLSEVFKSNDHLPISEAESKQTLSTPFHEMLTDKEIDTVLKWIK